MRVLILGASGMLGHKLCQTFMSRFETYATVRREPTWYAKYQIFNPQRLVGGVSAEDFDSVVRALAIVRPEVVVNCIGIVKQASAASDPIASITINALFPHRVAELCRAIGARFINISTDCVFSGRKGMYTEEDPSDAEDLYGRTKFLGEVSQPHCLTVRTSMIGRELETSMGLLEWFLSQTGKKVFGYSRAIFSGFTTQALAEILANIVSHHPALSGMWHVSSQPISKYELLMLIKEILGVNVEIEQHDAYVCDRSLDSARFRAVTGFTPATWREMILQLRDDSIPYEIARGK